jgi:hypothetical protein
MKNVADTLRTPTRRWPWIGGGVAAAGLVVAAVVVGPSFAAQLNPVPAPTATMTPYVATLTQGEKDSVQQAAEDQQTKIAADKAVADAAAAQAAADAAAAAAPDPGPGYAPGQAPAGTPIPMHLDNDPNSGSYGQTVIANPDTFCASNGGTTRSDGVAVCS